MQGKVWLLRLVFVKENFVYEVHEGIPKELGKCYFLVDLWKWLAELLECVPATFSCRQLRGRAWGWLDQKGSSLSKRIRCLYKRAITLPFSSMWSHNICPCWKRRRQGTILEAESSHWQTTKCSSALILNSPVSGTVINKFILFRNYLVSDILT
jgi:hypothetical protein